MNCARKKLEFFFLDNARKHKYDMKEIKLWCKVLFKIGVEQFENN